MLRGIGGRRRSGRLRMRWLDGITDLMNIRLTELRELVMDREAWKIDGEIKNFSDKQKLREFSINKPTLQQMLKGLI